MARKRPKPLPPEPGHWEGDTYIFGPTAYEQMRAEQERQREREHKRWMKQERERSSHDDCIDR